MSQGPLVPWQVVLLIVTLALAIIGAQGVLVQGLFKRLLVRIDAEFASIKIDKKEQDTKIQVAREDNLRIDGRVRTLERDRQLLATKPDLSKGLGRIHRRVDQMQDVLMEHARCIPGAKKLILGTSIEESGDDLNPFHPDPMEPF